MPIEVIALVLTTVSLLFLYSSWWCWQITGRLNVVSMNGYKVWRRMLNSRRLLMELSTMVISAHCSALMSARRLIDSSKEFAPICTTQHGALNSVLFENNILTFVLWSFHAGVNTLTISSSASRISDAVFKDAIQEYQLEEQDDAEPSECYELGWVLTTETQKRAFWVESGLASQWQWSLLAKLIANDKVLSWS